MYAVEFESFIKGNTLEIPAHLLQRISKNRQVKVIMLMPEKQKRRKHLLKSHSKNAC